MIWQIITPFKVYKTAILLHVGCYFFAYFIIIKRFGCRYGYHLHIKSSFYHISLVELSTVFIVSRLIVFVKLFSTFLLQVLVLIPYSINHKKLSPLLLENAPNEAPPKQNLVPHQLHKNFLLLLQIFLQY